MSLVYMFQLRGEKENRGRISNGDMAVCAPATNVDAGNTQDLSAQAGSLSGTFAPKILKFMPL